MYNPNADLVTLEDIHKAHKLLMSSPHFRRTPMMHHTPLHYGIDPSVDLHLKLENMQVTGSFKIRGLINQLKSLPEGCGTDKNKLISLSAGNYGKAFAYLTSKIEKKALLLMPDTAPPNRADLIESYGVQVEKLPTPQLQATVDRYVATHNMHFLHPFDDPLLIAGYGSIGIEIMEEVGSPDIVLVCCGGGGALSGIAAAIKLSGHNNCRIYGVEPLGSRTMYESYKAGRAISMDVKSVAAGLSPPYAGSNTFKHCKSFVEDILLVTDEEIVSAMFCLYDQGVLSEPSGAAAFAALYHDKVPDVKGKTVVVMVTGGNVSPEELYQLSKRK